MKITNQDAEFIANFIVKTHKACDWETEVEQAAGRWLDASGRAFGVQDILDVSNKIWNFIR